MIPTTNAWEQAKKMKAAEDAKNAELFQMFNQPMPEPVNKVPARMTNPTPAEAMAQAQDAQATAAKSNAASAALTPHDPRSGTQQGMSITDEARRNLMTNHALWADPEQITELTKAFAATPAMQAQEAGQKRLEDLLSMEAATPAPRSAYWTKPLAALSDYMNAKRGIATNNMASIAPEQASEDRTAKLMAYAQQLQKDRADYNAKMLDAAKAWKAGTAQDQFLQQITNKIDAATGKPIRGMGAGGTFTPNQFANQVRYALGKSDEAIGQITQMQAQVASGNPLDINRLKIIRASLDAHGRPNMAEINAETGDPRLAERIKQAWTRLVDTGGFTETNRKEYEQSLALINDHLDVVRRIQARRLTNMGLKGGVAPEFVTATIPPEYADLTAAVNKGTKQSADQKPKGALDRLAEQFMAERKAKAANGGK